MGGNNSTPEKEKDDDDGEELPRKRGSSKTKMKKSPSKPDPEKSESRVSSAHSQDEASDESASSSPRSPAVVPVAEKNSAAPKPVNAATCLKDCDKVVTGLKDGMKVASDHHQDLYKQMLSVMASIAQNHSDIEKYHNEYLERIHQIEDGLKGASALADILHTDKDLTTPNNESKPADMDATAGE